MALDDQIIAAESGGDPNAKNPNSSATGAGQFLGQTWLGLIKQYRPDLADGKSDADLLAMRSDPTLSREMTGAYAGQNAQYLGKNGFQATPGNLYLAHFAGPQGAVSVLSADPNAPASSVLSSQAVTSNPFLKNMTVGQLQSWASNKVSGQPSSPSMPTLISLPSQSVSSLPPVRGQSMDLDSFLAANGNAGGLPDYSNAGMLNNMPMNIAPQQAPQAAQQQGGGLMGFLNGNNMGGVAGMAQGTAPQFMRPQQQAAPQQQQPPQMQPMQLANGTPAAQMMRQQILAQAMRGLLSPQGQS